MTKKSNKKKTEEKQMTKKSNKKKTKEKQMKICVEEHIRQEKCMVMI